MCNKEDLEDARKGKHLACAVEEAGQGYLHSRCDHADAPGICVVVYACKSSVYAFRGLWLTLRLEGSGRSM